jgi:hypothetical protein
MPILPSLESKEDRPRGSYFDRVDSMDALDAYVFVGAYFEFVEVAGAGAEIPKPE